MQPTESDIVAKITAQAGAGAAALGAMSTALKDLPDTVTIIVISTAAVAALIAVGAWAYRGLRA